MPPIRLSVIIPTHNRRELVLRAVQSILGQDADRQGLPDSDPDAAACVQVIIVDDGSTDGTREAVDLRYGTDSRVQLLGGPRGFASAARNRGFAAARGELVCFLDSDDSWLPGTLDRIERVFARYPQLAFVSIDGSTEPEPGKPTLRHIVRGSPGWSHAQFGSAPLRTERIAVAEGDATATLLLHGDFFPAIIQGDLFYLSGLVIRREAVAAAGPFNERFRYFNDWEFFARLCLQGPGAYLEHDGFRRLSGRTDQISRGRPLIAMPRRQLFIVRRFLRSGDPRLCAYRLPLQHAFDDACYWMGGCLAGSKHRSWAPRYLVRCIRHRHKLLRSIACLMGFKRYAQTF